jgi:hypothetical protein
LRPNPTFLPTYFSPIWNTVPTVRRPSLKITRHDGQEPPGDVGFEVSRLA